MAHRILLVGGGSGGHTYPLVAVAGELKELAKQKNINLQLMVMGDGVFARAAAREIGAPFGNVISGKLRRYSSFENFTDALKMPFGLVQALWHMYWFMPDVIFAKGGYASVLPVIAGRFYMIKVILHETDSVPGLANRILAKRASKILLSFESAKEHFPNKETEVVGNPVRRELFVEDKGEALDFFRLNRTKKTILVLGGSQGARAVNEVVSAALVRLTQNWQVIHQAGDNNYKTIQAESDNIIKEGKGSYGQNVIDNYRLFPFLNAKELAYAYSAADVVVSRAGGTIFEIAMAGKPAILIPLPNSGGDHQLTNALEMSRHGAVVLEESNLTATLLLSEIDVLLRPENYDSFASKIKEFSRPDSARRIAEILLT